LIVSKTQPDKFYEISNHNTEHGKCAANLMKTNIKFYKIVTEYHTKRKTN